MDPDTPSRELEPTYRLLALCARAEGHPAFRSELKAQVRAFAAWDQLVSQAEVHGISGLLWHHLQEARLVVPRATQTTLAGLYLRQRAFVRAQTAVLLETCSLLESRQIRPLVLKGLALAYQYYPDPALRSVGDIDLLVKESEMLPALQTLATGGFQVRWAPHGVPSRVPEEITALSPPNGGSRTLVELHQYGHRRPSFLGDPRQEELWGLDASPQPLQIGEAVVQVPAYADTLDYLQLHLRRHLIESTTERPLPLKWIADIVSLVERHAAEMDWTYLRRHGQPLLRRLSVFYSLTPMPERLVEIIPIEVTRPPSGINQYTRGWPGTTYRGRAPGGLLKLAWGTIARPSDWWLRLYNGIGQRECWWYGSVIRPLQLLHLALRSLLRRLK